MNKHGRSRWSGKKVMFVLLIMGLCITAYHVAGPSLYWHLSESISSSIHSSCPSCPCDCSNDQFLHSFSQVIKNFRDTKWAHLPTFDCREHAVIDRWRKSKGKLCCSDSSKMSTGLNVSTFTDCMEHDLGVSDEEERNFTALLTEELKQMESETQENQRKADMALLEAKKMVSQYQKEADKCTSGMGTCEEAREKAEIALEAQRQVTSMWELRARHQGWRQEL